MSNDETHKGHKNHLAGHPHKLTPQEEKLRRKSVAFTQMLEEGKAKHKDKSRDDEGREV